MNQSMPASFGSDQSLMPKIMQECPLCGKNYDQRSIRVVHEAEETKLIHVTCMSCRHAVAAYIMWSQLGISSVGMLTDLNAEELKQSVSKSSISADDVLHVHTMLHTNEFIYLFKT